MEFPWISFDSSFVAAICPPGYCFLNNPSICTSSVWFNIQVCPAGTWQWPSGPYFPLLPLLVFLANFQGSRQPIVKESVLKKFSWTEGNKKLSKSTRSHVWTKDNFLSQDTCRLDARPGGQVDSFEVCMSPKFKTFRCSFIHCLVYASNKNVVPWRYVSNLFH